MTLEEVRAEQRYLENRIEIIRSDMRREPVRVEREHLESLRPFQEKLARLRHKRTNGRALIAIYEDRIAVLRAELDLLKHRDGIARLLKLVKETNKLQGIDTKVDAVIEEAAACRERVVECRYLVRAYEDEIVETKRAMDGAFEQREAQLEDAIIRREKWFSDFCMNRIEGPVRIAACRERIVELNGLAQQLSQGSEVRKLEQMTREIEQLMLELGADKVAAALRG